MRKRKRMAMVKDISKGEAVEKAGATGLCAGANLRTPCGLRRVENLRKGDLVVTRDNGLQPVRMLWKRVVAAAEIAADPSLAPVVLRPRAIGPMMPQRDLAVGGAHRLLIPGWRLADEEDGESCLVPDRDIAGLRGQQGDVPLVDLRMSKAGVELRPLAWPGATHGLRRPLGRLVGADPGLFVKEVEHRVPCWKRRSRLVGVPGRADIAGRHGGSRPPRR